MDIAFQNEDAVSLGKSHGRPARKKAAPALVCPSTSYDSRSTPLTTSTTSTHAKLSLPYFIAGSQLGIPCALPENISSHSVPLILDQYSAIQFEAKSASPRGFGYHSFLPILLEKHNHSCLKLAVEAWADAYVKNKSENALGASYRPSIVYGKALRAVNECLRDPAALLQDTTLAAVWVLGNYEVSILKSKGSRART